jgi:hypothetical protein
LDRSGDNGASIDRLLQEMASANKLRALNLVDFDVRKDLPVLSKIASLEKLYFLRSAFENETIADNPKILEKFKEMPNLKLIALDGQGVSDASNCEVVRDFFEREIPHVLLDFRENIDSLPWPTHHL